MQEFAPTNSRLSGECPSDEELAAYIDGALDEKEARRVAEHLVSCERCYEIYTETVQFQLEDKPETGANVVPIRRIRKGSTIVQWLSIAALLLVGVGAVLYFQVLQAPPKLMASTLTAPLQRNAGLTQELWLGPTLRGSGDENDDTRPMTEASFQMGVQLVNLWITLEANDREGAVGSIIPRTLQVLKAQDTAGPLKDSYLELSKDLLKTPPRDSLEKAAQLAQDSEEYFDKSYLDLGQWVEAAHLAAVARNPHFFRRAVSQRFLRRLRWNDKLGLHEVKLDPTTRQSLQTAVNLSESHLRPADYAAIDEQLKKILETYYPMQ